MVDVASIVIAIISLVGSVLSAGFTGWISFYNDQSQRAAEAKRLTNKYRDPLTLSAYDLQSRLFGILERNLLAYVHDESRRELVHLYTAFLIGQYLSWVYIFRRQAQFLRFSTDEQNQGLTEIIDSITDVFGTDGPSTGRAFMLWRAEQLAIGEIMTVRDEDGELYCMGYAEFRKKCINDPVFKAWFTPVDDGINELVVAFARGNAPAGNRSRRLQHLLVDLVSLLGAAMLKNGHHRQDKVNAAPECECKNCPKEKDTIRPDNA